MNLVWKNSVSPQGVLRIRQSLSHQRFMANSPHSEQGHIVPYLYFQRDQRQNNDPSRQLIFLNVSLRASFLFFETIFPDGNSEFEIHDVISKDHELSTVTATTAQCLRFFVSAGGGGTHTCGNSCLGRRFLWAARSGHIHKARQEARWDRAPIYCV